MSTAPQIAEQALRAVLNGVPGLRLAVLFGSAARGQQDARSDIDLGVSFDPGTPLRDAELQLSLSRASRRRVDLVRLDDAPPLLRFEIARDGRPLVERSPHAWVDFKARAMVDWWDWSALARIFHAAAVRRLREQIARGTP